MKPAARAGWWIAFALGCAVWLITCGLEPTRSRQALENERTKLTDELTRLQVNLDKERLQWYYAFREVEEPDDKAWELAVRKVDSAIAVK